MYKANSKKKSEPAAKQKLQELCIQRQIFLKPDQIDSFKQPETVYLRLTRLFELPWSFYYCPGLHRFIASHLRFHVSIKLLKIFFDENDAIDEISIYFPHWHIEDAITIAKLANNQPLLDKLKQYHADKVCQASDTSHDLDQQDLIRSDLQIRPEVIDYLDNPSGLDTLSGWQEARASKMIALFERAIHSYQITIAAKIARTLCYSYYDFKIILLVNIVRSGSINMLNQFMENTHL